MRSIIGFVCFTWVTTQFALACLSSTSAVSVDTPSNLPLVLPSPVNIHSNHAFNSSMMVVMMTTIWCPRSSKSFWWGFAPDITDWTVICTANWSWHPHQPAPVVKKNKPQSTFYKDAPFTKLQEKTCGLSALPWWPNSTAANRSWRRRHHSSPKRPWSCRLRTPRRRKDSSMTPQACLPHSPHQFQ